MALPAGTQFIGGIGVSQDGAVYVTSGGGGGGTIVTTSNFVEAATPTGTIDGTDGTDGNAVFTIVSAPLLDANGQPIFSLVKTDIGTGVIMTRSVSGDYTLSGTTITYNSGSIPIVGQEHFYSGLF